MLSPCGHSRHGEQQLRQESLQMRSPPSPSRSRRRRWRWSWTSTRSPRQPWSNLQSCHQCSRRVVSSLLVELQVHIYFMMTSWYVFSSYFRVCNLHHKSIYKNIKTLSYVSWWRGELNICPKNLKLYMSQCETFWNCLACWTWKYWNCLSQAFRVFQNWARGVTQISAQDRIGRDPG